MSGRIAVRSELVKEFLVDRILAEIDERYPGDLDADARFAAAWESAGGSGSTEEAQALAADVARRGYLGRVVETDLFAVARAPTPGLADRLSDRSAADVSADLARDEPAEKAAPSEDAWTSWRVPGPGGHVRHFVALESVVTALPRSGNGNRGLPEGADRPTLKRAWFFGFYLRVCEEVNRNRG